MSDQSTRATPPNPDPRQSFTLSLEDAQGLYGASIDPAKDANDLNTWWLEAGKRLGFVWTTVADLELHGDGENITSATFSAWPEVAEWQPDSDAQAWLEGMVAVGDPTTLKNRELILRAFSAGTDHGFAMGVATVPDAGLGWDGMELLRELAELLRTDQADDQGHGDMLAELDPEGAAIHHGKASRRGQLADKLEAFLADPSQSHLIHDGLREARGDAALGVMVGWECAIVAVRELVDDMQKNTGPSALPPLVLLSRLEKLEAPEDMDEMLGPWRGVSEAIAQIAELRGTKPAWASIVQGGGWHASDHLRWARQAAQVGKDWLERTDWVQELVSLGVDKRLGMKPQWGKHRADTLRELVGQLNNLLAQAIAGTLAGLHVQAAADVLAAIGVSPTAPVPENPELDAHMHGDAQPVPGVYRLDQGQEADCGGSAAMLGAIHGGPCIDRAPFVAWCSAGFADGDIVEVREKDGHCHPMKVGSIQFRNALADLGERMPVRAATAEQLKGWEGPAERLGLGNPEERN